MYSVDHASSLGGPAWLHGRRQVAAERAGAAGLPSTEDEHWRYSRIGELDVAAFAPLRPAGDAPAGLPAGARAALATVSGAAGGVVVCNGRVVHTELAGRWREAGVRLGPVADHDAGEALFGSVLDEPRDLFEWSNEAFGVDPVVLDVPDGVVVDEPVVVVHWLESDGLAVFPRLIVRTGAQAQVTVVDHAGSTDVHGLVVPVVELDAGPGSRLAYVAVQVLGERVWTVGTQRARVGRDATVAAALVALGGDYARVQAEAALVDKGAEARQIAVYFGVGSQMHDVRTLQDHRAPHTTSDLLFKGAVGGHARSVYSGLVRVGKEAPGTAAFQTNRTITLSEGAWAESVPNLEIENNDVRCSHASAVGPIDPEQVFYLQTRGVPPDAAERLIVTGFFDEILERLPVAELMDPLRAHVAERLARAGTTEPVPPAPAAP